MKAKIFGYRGPLERTSLIEKELVSLGVELTDHSPDFVFHMNGLFDDSEAFCDSCFNRPKKIYQLLDIDHGKDLSFYSKARQHLLNADAITFISETSKRDILKTLELSHSKSEVIYYPIIGITNQEIPFENKKYDFGFIGRVFSNNKRFALALQAADMIEGSKFVVAGPENPGNVNYVGVLSSQELNNFYNSCRFVFMTSSFEGIGLSMIEAVLAGAYPVLCSDCNTVHEFGLSLFSADPNPLSLAKKVLDIESNRKYTNSILKNACQTFREKFDPQNVAKKIISIYESLL